MRIFIALVVGLAGGFLLGLVLSQVIAIVGLLLVSQPVGIKFLPIYLALAGVYASPRAPGRHHGDHAQGPA
ncbi:MAG: hypothetical protein HGA45_05165 [Chloroflexales bacterium]|nr:hypothetical protein [Chloroflexales bacterium]